MLQRSAAVSNRHFFAIHLLVAAALLIDPVSAAAGPADHIRGRVVANLERAATTDEAVLIPGFPLGNGSLGTIEVKRTRIWAADGKVIVERAGGEREFLPAPEAIHFIGHVVGVEDSGISLTLERGGVRGFAMSGNRRFRIASGVRLDDRGQRRQLAETEPPVFVFEIDDVAEIGDPAAAWTCELDRHPGLKKDLQEPAAEDLERTESSSSLRLRSDAGNVPGASYSLRIAFDTDDELYAAFGSVESVTAYIGDLVAAASIMYQRDLNTTLTIGHVVVRAGGPGTDPYTAATSAAALAEFGTYWHNNYAQATFPRSAAHLLSGKLTSSGIAWSNQLCANDFYCGDTGASCNGGNPSATWAGKWGGAYGFLGSSGSVTTTVPNPTQSVNGVLYAVPSTANYWMLLQFAHELGHNANSPHTHCVGLTAGEKVTYGVTRDFVDICASGECYVGTTSAPPELGTIMSYCHNIFSGGFRQSRYLFWKAGETSEKMTSYFTTGLELRSPNPTITTGSPPVACAAGQSASVASCASCTYNWSILGGTITSATNGTSVTYTPNSASVTLTVTVVSARGCGITASKTIASACSEAPPPPTGVVATATTPTNVLVTWSASQGAASYNVYRSTNGTTFSLRGNTASTSFNDGASAGTAYLYMVRATNGTESSDSNRDLATTVIFTDATLTAGVTTMKAAHVTELRTAANAVRTLAGLGNASFTDAALAGVACKAIHITELRTALNAARTALLLPAISYTDATITAGTTPIKAAHITQLRDGVK